MNPNRADKTVRELSQVCRSQDNRSGLLPKGSRKKVVDESMVCGAWLHNYYLVQKCGVIDTTLHYKSV